MIDTPPPKEEAQIHKLSISNEYKDNALRIIKNIIKGNQYNPDEMVLEKFEGSILQFLAENRITILKKVSHTRKHGRLEGPKAVENEDMAHDAMNKAYLALHEDNGFKRKIKEMLMDRDDQGFALDQFVIPLNFWRKEFVTFEPCQTCKRTGSVKCLPCGGDGEEPCNRCYGSGEEHCGHCKGAQTILGPDGHKVQCTVCAGRGRTPCRQCNQIGRTPCRVCAKRGVTQCPNCRGHAWVSHIFILELEARTDFDYPVDKLPEKVVGMIEKHGAKIAEHADIKISNIVESVVNRDDVEKTKEAYEAEQRGDLIIPLVYEVLLPQAHIEYNIKGKIYYTFLFGKNAVLEHVSPFLDDLLKEGMRKLHDASEGRGDVTENLKKAAAFRTIKEVIFYTMSHSTRKAKALIKRRYKFGLSEPLMDDMLAQTHIAFKKITSKPRKVGLALSGLITLTCLASYFLSPLREVMVSNIGNKALHVVPDIAIFAGVSYIAIMVIQAVLQKAVRNITQMIGIKKTPAPKMEDTLYWSAGLSCGVFLLVLEIGRQVTQTAPGWYSGLF